MNRTKPSSTLKLGALLLACLGSGLLAAPASAGVRERTVWKSGTESKCHDFTIHGCIRNFRRSSYPFGVALVGNDNYDIDNVWLRVKPGSGSGDKTLATIKSNLEAHFALFQFHDQDVADRLGKSLDTLKAEGFRVRLKFESLGAGSGRQDKCPAFSFRWDAGAGAWTYAQGNTPESSDYKPVPNLFTLEFNANGSLNDVKCGFEMVVKEK